MQFCSIENKFIQTEIGILEICSCSNGIHEIRFPCEDAVENPPHALNLREITGKESKMSAMALSLLWLKSYFEVPHEVAKLHLPPICKSVFSTKGNFTQTVWRTLMESVPIGKTVSYGALAALSGNAAASRAVGTAMKNNPVPVIIPCHRVVKSDGGMGHYSGGKGIKEWLIKHEKSSFK